jgi:hypothetical protein
LRTQALDRQQPRDLLARLLDTPNLATVVRALDPQILRRVVHACGLEDCGEIVALATPEQLMRVFDLDLWGSARPGQQDQFDADRFGVWLDVLVDAGAELAAEKIAGFDFDFVTAAVTRHLLVLDRTWKAPAESLSCEISGYTIVARRTDAWDAWVAVLAELDAKRPDFFQVLMARCYRIASDYIDDNGGLPNVLYHVVSASAQILSDVADDREERREKQGYVTATQAVAFLELSRRLPLALDAVPPRDRITASYFRDIAPQPMAAPRAVEQTQELSPDSTPVPSATDVATFLETLRDAGIVPETPRLLLAAGDSAATTRLSRLREHMQFACERDPNAFAERNAEIGYLANALVSGCRFNTGHFNAAEAYDAVLAVCNLGLENWPSHWIPASDVPGFLLRYDLVTVFQVGWTTTFQHVSVYAAEHLRRILLDVKYGDGEVQSDIQDLCSWLRHYLEAGTPWLAYDRLDVIAILDTPTWATLLGLIDQCPVVPKNLQPRKAQTRMLRVSTEYEFISDNRQIAWVREFVESLPERLTSTVRRTSRRFAARR